MRIKRSRRSPKHKQPVQVPTARTDEPVEASPSGSMARRPIQMPAQRSERPAAQHRDTPTRVMRAVVGADAQGPTTVLIPRASGSASATSVSLPPRTAGAPRMTVARDRATQFAGAVRSMASGPSRPWAPQPSSNPAAFPDFWSQVHDAASDREWPDVADPERELEVAVLAAESVAAQNDHWLSDTWLVDRTASWDARMRDLTERFARMEQNRDRAAKAAAGGAVLNPAWAEQALADAAVFETLISKDFRAELAHALATGKCPGSAVAA